MPTDTYNESPINATAIPQRTTSVHPRLPSLLLLGLQLIFTPSLASLISRPSILIASFDPSSPLSFLVPLAKETWPEENESFPPSWEVALWSWAWSLLLQSFLHVEVVGIEFKDEKNYYSPPDAPPGSPPPSGSYGHGSPPQFTSPPPHGHAGTPTPPYHVTPSHPTPPTPAGYCGTPPPGHNSTRSTPPPIGGYYPSPPTSGGTPPTPAPLTPPATPIDPGTPSTPTTIPPPSGGYYPSPPPPPSGGYYPSPPTSGDTPPTPAPLTPPATPIDPGTPSTPTTIPPPSGGYYPSPPTSGGTPPTPVLLTPPATPIEPGTPSTPTTIPPPSGGYYSSPPTSGGGSPPTSVILTPPATPIDPGTPSSPSIPVPPFGFGPNTNPFTGSYTYWLSNPGTVLGLFGWWVPMGTAFGVPTTIPGFPSNLNLVQALSNPRTDGLGALYREGTAALLNSMVNYRFPFTTAQVQQSFVSALRSNGAASAQARLFKLANEGRLEPRG
ncbi:protodermal factor 1 [Rhodamnia argentea]|uniref:Protodermal factor 1 n=1 Tax=Rhodamnia argentea TaxID=178133 RepID=A0ABM3GTW3_9MYRT|nr:protodermal factor 1 [Rhodamnia argentea]